MRSAGTFELHPAHNQWQVGDVALFEVRQGSPRRPVEGASSIETTDCTSDTARVRFTLPGSGGGNRKLTVTGTSPRATPALCGVGAPNR
jgi:hypothetical protein